MEGCKGNVTSKEVKAALETFLQTESIIKKMQKNLVLESAAMGCKKMSPDTMRKFIKTPLLNGDFVKEYETVHEIAGYCKLMRECIKILNNGNTTSQKEYKVLSKTYLRKNTKNKEEVFHDMGLSKGTYYAILNSGISSLTGIINLYINTINKS